MTLNSSKLKLAAHLIRLAVEVPISINKLDIFAHTKLTNKEVANIKQECLQWIATDRKNSIAAMTVKTDADVTNF